MPSWVSPSPSMTNVWKSSPRIRAPEGDPQSDREALAERAGRRLEARQAGHVRVALEPAVARVERGELLDREVAAQRHRHVQADGRVALREDEPVALGPVRLVGADAQDPEEEGEEHVHRRQRPADVAGAAVGDRFDDEQTATAGEIGEIDLWFGSPVRRQRHRTGRTRRGATASR